MNIGIIGGGSLGLLLISYLTVQNNDVNLYVRRERQKECIEARGVQLYTQSQLKQTVSVKVATTDQLGKHDLYIVCVKQPHIYYVTNLLKKVANNRTILFLQNGMGHVEEAKNLQASVILGIVEHGAHRISDVSVDHLGIGKIKLAPLSISEEYVQQLVDQLHSPYFPFEYCSNWRHLLQEKLIVNAVINPLTALFNIKNGELLTNENYYFLAKRLYREAMDILPLNKETTWEKIKNIMEKTKNNTSSMLADLQQNRETEIQAISGYILEKAAERERQLPYTTFVYKAIRGLEQKGHK